MEEPDQNEILRLSHLWSGAIQNNQVIELTAGDIDCIIGAIAALHMTTANTIAALNKANLIKDEDALGLIKSLIDSRIFNDRLLLHNSKKVESIEGKKDEQ